MKDYDGLTERDIGNLKFLINASDDVLKDWMNSVSQDDLDYADELLEMFRCRLTDMAADISDMRDARNVLAKYSVS